MRVSGGGSDCGWVVVAVEIVGGGSAGSDHRSSIGVAQPLLLALGWI